MFIISSISVKNNIATSVLYIKREHSIIVKTDYYLINILFTEAKLFTMRCDISQVSKIQDVIHIIIITNVILVAKRNPNNTITIRVVNNRLSFILFSFSFIFLYFILSFFFFIWTQVKKTKYDITCHISHTLM